MPRRISNPSYGKTTRHNGFGDGTDYMNGFPGNTLYRRQTNLFGSARFLVFLSMALIALTAGCHRSQYRKKADAEAYHLVREKANHPHWSLPDYTINVDPRSRMYTPYNPDAPPMPPDDPAAHKLMRRVDNKPGYPGWDVNGRTPFVENPNWLSFVPLDEEGTLTINHVNAVKLARLHSPNYQRELEDLYLSALDVSFERFVFDSQFFAGYSGFFTADGRDRSGGGGESSSELDIGLSSSGPRPAALRKMGITGSELIVGFANRLVWQFSGPDMQTATSLLDFSLVQPLLKNAGRDRIMERLTLSERTLLSNVRQMERFQRGFYVEVMTGRDAGDGPSRRGGVFGGSGLTGFTGTGGGGFGQLAGGGGSSRGGGQTGAGQAGGFLGLLQQQQSIRNQGMNIVQLRSSLSRFEAFRLASRLDVLQVQQARQALYNAESGQLNSETQYQNQLDNYKISLGLPPQLDVKIEDPLLNQFNLIDPRMVSPQQRLSELQEQAGSAVITFKDLQQPDWNDVAAALGQLGDLVRRTQTEVLQHVLEDNIAHARSDISELFEKVPQQQRQANRVHRGYNERGKPKTEFAELDDLVERLHELKDTLDAMHRDIVHLQQSASSGSGGFWQWFSVVGPIDKVVFEPTPNTLGELSDALVELMLLQVRARADIVELESIELDDEVAFEVARDFRRDLMNRRAALVDTWRLIEFNADDLESSLDIVFEGDISNVNDNPFDLRGSTGRLRAGVQFDAPLVRLDERNTYRQALIEYQQARRNYYQARDRISQSLRSTLRTIDLNRRNFELRREAIHAAVRQVEKARFNLVEPPKPGEESDRLGATTARDLVSALADLQNAQNDFISVWVNYEVQRRALDFDMGTMQIDCDGIWMDPGPIGEKYGFPAAGNYKSCSSDVLVLPHRHQLENEPQNDVPPPAASSENDFELDLELLPAVDGQQTDWQELIRTARDE